VARCAVRIYHVWCVVFSSVIPKLQASLEV
jgi:hypothetical protein